MNNKMIEEKVHKNHFDELDILKGILILTVVLEHSFAVKYVDLSTVAWCTTTVAIIKSFNMQLFFMISGFLFANSKTTNIGKALISKVDRLLVPMLFLSIINIALFWVAPSAINGDERRGLMETIMNVLLYGKSFWFIYTLFVIFVFVILLKKYLNKTITIMIILALIVLYESGFVQSEMFQIKNVSYFSVYFLLGYLAYGRYDDIKKILKSPWFLVPSLIIYILLFLFAYDNSIVYRWILPPLLDSIMIGFVLVLVEFLNNYKYPVLKYLGKNSLQFFMFNGYALVVSRILYAKVLNIHQPFLLFLLVYLSCLLIIWLLVEITKRIPVISYLCGFGKKKSGLDLQKVEKTQ